MSDFLHRPLRAALPALLVPSLLLSGCTTVRDALDADNVEYREARSGPALDVPPDLVAPKADSRYTLPARDDSQSLSDFNRQRDQAQGDERGASGAGVLPQSQHARIHREGTTRWVSVQASPEEIWPLLLDFWAVQGFNLETAQPKLGLMETEWAERYQKVENSGIRGILARKAGTVYATGDRDKYRTRLERNAQGGTDIFLTYYGREEQLRGARKEDSIWVPNDSNRNELEAEYLQRILTRLDAAFAHGELGRRGGAASTAVSGAPAGADTGGSAGAVGTAGAAAGASGVGASGAGAAAMAGADAAAQGADGAAADGQSGARARIVAGAEGQPSKLQLQDDFDRSWRAVGVVLDRLDFSIEDRNREQGVYDIVYVDPQRRDRNQGTWSRIFSGERKDLSGQHYQLHIQGEGSQSTVEVLLADGKQPTSEEDRRVADEIIRILNENLR